MSSRLALIAAAALAACGGTPGSAPAPASPAPVSRAGAVAAGAPDVVLLDDGTATVRGRPPLTFDGLTEGLAWPSLARAIGPVTPGQTVTMAVGRALPMTHLLRAAWTLRQADLRIQSADAGGVLRAVQLQARRDGAPSVAGCHLAVFVRPDGSLRVASPGGASLLSGPDAPASLARSLEGARANCPLRYVAFGAESDASAWGPVLDVVLGVDSARSAGDARYVLGQAMR